MLKQSNHHTITLTNLMSNLLYIPGVVFCYKLALLQYYLKINHKYVFKCIDFINILRDLNDCIEIHM